MGIPARIPVSQSLAVKGARHIATSIALCIAARSAEAQAPTADPLPARLDRLFASVDSTTTPGCVVGAARAGLPTLYRSYGMADLERPTRIDTGTAFEAGSVSKQFIAAAVLLLSYEGKLSLDDDIRRFIPELRVTQPVTTVRHLLTHQSGLRDFGDIMEQSGWPRGSRLYTQHETLALIARQSARNFAPSAEYSYSNSNYVVGAVLVERAAGESLNAYSRRKIFAPLGMTHTQWRVDFTQRVENRAIGWTPDDSGVWKIDMPFENVVGNGGLLTTVPDLMRWQETFRSDAIGGARFAEDMQRTGVLRDGRVTAYALGLESTIERGQRTLSHGGWTAGYKSYVGRIPAHALAVALLCNAGSLRTDVLGPQLLALADGDTTVAADDSPPELGPPATDASRRSIAGMYRNVRTRQAVMVRSFRDGITINTWVPFLAAGTDRFAGADGTRIIAITRRRDGAVPSFRTINAGVDTVLYTRVGEWAPPVSLLATFTGTYQSSDAEATWHLETLHDTLTIVRRPGQRDALVPRYLNAFLVPTQGWLVNVTRDAAGRINGLDVGLSRTRTVHYVRTTRVTPVRAASRRR
jgi:CubicO group peptidase (beta-lactamase class C family)